MSSSGWAWASSRRWPTIPARDSGFEKLDAGHLFAPSTTRLALRRGVFLRGYVYDFIALFAPALDRATVDAALARSAAGVTREGRAHGASARTYGGSHSMIRSVALLARRDRSSAATPARRGRASFRPSR